MEIVRKGKVMMLCREIKKKKRKLSSDKKEEYEEHQEGDYVKGFSPVKYKKDKNLIIGLEDDIEDVDDNSESEDNVNEEKKWKRKKWKRKKKFRSNFQWRLKNLYL